MLQSKSNVLTMVALLLLGFIQGCQSEQDRGKEQSRQIDARPGLLYLKELPYQQLYVEVDTLEGTEVPEIYIEKIRDFLNRYCSKPDGVKIVQDSPVSFEQDELSPGLMSLLCTDGPLGNQDGQPAYLHIFFYDSQAEKVTSFMRNPHVNVACPTAVYINIDYIKRFHQSMAIHVIKHEIGHILGLCANTSHGDGQHCRNNSCLMNISPDLFSQLATLIQLPMKSSELCDDCRNDIIYAGSQRGENNLSFKGPFLFEQKTDNSVMSLPYFNVTVPENASDSLGWKEVLSKMQNYIRSNDKQIMIEIKSKKRETCITAEYGVN